MKRLDDWEQTLNYVNRIGVANSHMPIGWAQQVLMENVQAIEKVCEYPLTAHYNRAEDIFTVRSIYNRLIGKVKAIHH